MTECSPVHVPVLLEEVRTGLNPQPGQILVDGTLGAGGHTRALAREVVGDGYIISLDRDPEAIAAAADNLSGLAVQLVQENFCNLPETLREMGVEQVDGILLDLGLSSDQLADTNRGFSFHSTGELDLRFDPTEGEPAWRLINRLSAVHLANLIYEYGQERHSRRIARKIVETRNQQPIRTAKQLADLLRSCVPRSRNHSIDPATRTFQALRIAVNDELKSLDIALRRLPDCLKPGGRMAVISFHSLEDRRVKHAFREDARLNVLTKKPIVPGDDEINSNVRSRSARLRIAERRTRPV